MPYTGDPVNQPADAVRFFCGDTDNGNLDLLDGEVTYALSLQPTNARLAAAICCDALSAKYTKRADRTVGEVSTRLGDRAKAFHEMAERLRNEAGKLAVPFFGGQSRSGKDALRSDADAVQPPAQVGQFDNPLARQFDGQAPDALLTGNT